MRAVVLIIIDIMLVYWSTLRVAQLGAYSANLHFVQILLNVTQVINIKQNKYKGEQYDNSM